MVRPTPRTVRPARAVAGTTREASRRAPDWRGMRLNEMERFIRDEFENEASPEKRARQVWSHLYADRTLADAFDSTFSAAFVDAAETSGAIFDAGLRLRTPIAQAADGTVKLLMDRGGDSGVPGSSAIETVLIPADTDGRRPRITVCVSSQVGCAMGCKFCFTGTMGLEANLATAEIVHQVVVAKRVAAELFPNAPVKSLVFMGMGEPLQNTDAVLQAIDILSTPGKGIAHLSERKMTVSTVGIVPEMRRLAKESKAQLAVSLHATTEEQRTSIIPQNRIHSLGDILACLEELFPKGRTEGVHGRHVLIEYVMLAGVNDTQEDARRLATLLAPLECKVNLIVFNTFDGSPFVPAERAQVRDFRETLVAAGFVCTVRDSRGDDTMAACGQLGSGKRAKKAQALVG